MSVNSLQSSEEAREIKKVNVMGQGQDSDGKTKWGLASDSTSEDVAIVSGESSNDINGVMSLFFEYVLGEWVEKKWASTFYGTKWGTSWYPAGGPGVVMTGRDQDQQKKVVLQMNLDRDSKKYVVGQYEVKSEKEKQMGVLSLGFGTCMPPEGPQCSIPKDQSITQRIEINFIDSQQN